MRKWLRRLRGAFGMGLTWAIGWGSIGFLLELITGLVPGWNGAIVDIWPMALGVPGFLGGAFFSVALGIAGRRRGFDELSLPGFAGLGALGGLVLTGLLGALGGFGSWLVIVGGVVTVLCSGSAAGSLALARRVGERALLEPGEDVAD